MAIKKEFFINYSKAGKNGFNDASRAVEFLLSQINSVEEDLLYSEDFCWSGDECTVPASLLNPVLRGLEAVGMHEAVVVIPVISGGPRASKRYILKPYLYNPEIPVKVGIAISDDI